MQLMASGDSVSLYAKRDFSCLLPDMRACKSRISAILENIAETANTRRAKFRTPVEFEPILMLCPRTTKTVCEFRLHSAVAPNVRRCVQTMRPKTDENTIWSGRVNKRKI